MCAFCERIWQDQFIAGMHRHYCVLLIQDRFVCTWKDSCITNSIFKCGSTVTDHHLEVEFKARNLQFLHHTQAFKMLCLKKKVNCRSLINDQNLVFLRVDNDMFNTSIITSNDFVKDSVARNKLY